MSDYYVKCVKYWTKMLHMPNFRYPNNCYRMLKGLDDIGRNTWASSVKHLLYIHGFGYVWLVQGVGNVDMSLFNFKQRVTDNLRQGRLETVNTTPRCSIYKYFKTMLNPER